MAEFTSIDKVIISDSEIFEYVSGNYYPEDIFEYKELANWAEDHGFVKKEN